jgi:DNA-binding NarL/FixJ family response regulator
MFDQLEARAWAAQAADELSRIGGRPVATGELTATESRIASLVTTGATNREIAATLYLSPKTVEAHVSRIYRKLGISSRRELRRGLPAGSPRRSNAG